MQRLQQSFRRVALVMASFLLLAAPSLAAADELVIAEGRAVSLEFTMSLDDGTVMDGNVGEAPFMFVQGGGQVLPALEEALVGRKAGDSLKVRLTPEQAYGAHNEELVRDVPAGIIPPESRRAGERLTGYDSQGRQFQVKVVEYREADDIVVLDSNHPLAGEHLNFDVRILAVN